MQPTLRLLGRFEFTTDSGAVLNIPGAKAQLLLARLALAGGERMDRATLSTMFWGERADAQARASLRQLIWSTRQAMKPFSAALVAEGETIALDPTAIGSDVAVFERLANASDPRDLEAALDLYRGDLLDGIDLITLAPDGFILHQRDRLRDLALRVAKSLVAQCSLDKNWEGAIRASRRGLVIEPFDEALQSHLVESLQRLGRLGEARHQDDVFRRRLKSELGVIAAAQVLQTSQDRPSRARPAAAEPVPVLSASARQGMPQARRFLWPVMGGVALVVGIVLAVAFGITRQLAAPPAAVVTPVAAVERLPTANLEAYDHFMRAESVHLIMTEDAQLPTVLAAYRQAFALDPNFADAFAGYASVAVEIWERSLDDVTPKLDARKDAYASAGRALEINPGNARALIVLSRIQAQDGAVSDALISARRAVAAEPAGAEAHANLALILAFSGNNTAAREELEVLRRLELVPREELLLVFGVAAFSDGRYDDAIADFAAIWPTIPNNKLMLEHLAAALAFQGRLREASRIKDHLLVLKPRANLRLIAQRYADLSSQKQNNRLLEGLRRAGMPEWPYGFSAPQDQRLTGPGLAYVASNAKWSGHLGDGSPFALQSDARGDVTYQGAAGTWKGRQFLNGEELCQLATDRPEARELCGPIYRATPGQVPESEFVYVTAEEVRYFSLLD